MRKRVWAAEELGLLETIHADPRPDAPRLIYADWLEDNGQPEYAEFIRLQCAPSPTPEMEWRESRLRRERFDAWCKPVPKSFHITFERGLPLAWLRPNLWTLARLTDLLTRISPRLRFICVLSERVLFHRDVGPAIFEHPIMRRVARFRVVPNPTTDAAAVAFVQQLASFRLPPTAEEINFMHLTHEAEALARELLEPRFRVTVQNRDPRPLPQP